MIRCKLQGVAASRAGEDPRLHLSQFGDKDMDPLIMRLYVARRCACFSRSLMAVALGVAPSTVWRWENGEIHTVSENVVREWASLTGFSYEWIVHGGRSGNWEADAMCLRLVPHFKKLIKPIPDKEAARLGIATTWLQARLRDGGAI